MSTAVAINVEPEEDEEVEQTEEPNEDEGGEPEENGENSVGDEEEDEPQPPPKRRRKKKRSFNYRPWICGFVVLLVIGLSIGLGVYFGVVKPKEDPKKPNDPKTTTPRGGTTKPATGKPDDSKVTEPPDETETTKKPRETSCYPVQNYALLGDDFMEPHKGGYKVAVFSGQVTHERMFSICERIDEKGRRIPDTIDISRGALYLNEPDEEKQVDDIIKKYEDRIFESGKKKLMWTGLSYSWQSDKWVAGFPVNKTHRNFCNQGKLDQDLEIKGKSIDKSKEKIYIVKNYEQANNCWEIYTAKELATITDQPADRNPRLSFACSFYHDGAHSGQDAVPGHFRPKYDVGNKYIFYKASATLEDAKKECEAHNSKLIEFKDKADMDTLAAEIKNIKPYFKSDLFWSGVYMDVSNGNSGSLIYSTTWKETLVPSGKDGQVMDAPLEKAAEKLIASIKSGQSRDCTSNFVYAGMSFKELAPNNRILLQAINAEGQLDQDSFRAYVACEKN